MYYIKNSENKTNYNESIQKIPNIPIKKINKNKQISSTITNYNERHFDKSNTARTTFSTPRNIEKRVKKRVKFNEYIEVIKVISYKKYYKEEELSIADYFDENFNYKPYNKRRKKEETICKCIII